MLVVLWFDLLPINSTRSYKLPGWLGSIVPLKAITGRPNRVLNLQGLLWLLWSAANIRCDASKCLATSFLIHASQIHTHTEIQSKPDWQRSKNFFFYCTNNNRMSIYRSKWPSIECPRIRFTEIVKGLTVIIFTAIKVMFYLQHVAKVALISISYCVTGVCNQFIFVNK
jgi:hypothetical protein